MPAPPPTGIELLSITIEDAEAKNGSDFEPDRATGPRKPSTPPGHRILVEFIVARDSYEAFRRGLSKLEGAS